MRREFSRRFRVRHDELDSFGHLNNAVLLKYLQEAAIQASEDAGYGIRWYEERGLGWVWVSPISRQVKKHRHFP